jgi:glycosyltransferase involved in cell wall biosynthesis
MRLGVLTTSYPRHAGDAAGSFVAGHVEALRALGHDVEVIAGGDPSPGTIRIPSRLLYRGGAPDLIERAPVRGALAGAVFTARLTAALAARAHRYDSIIAHWLVPSALAALPSRVPLLAIAHGGDIHTLRRMGLLAPVLHALALRGARLAFVSEQLRSIAVAAAPRLAGWLAQAIVQPMGIALDRFRALACAPADPPAILIASRLVRLKGIDVAIAAMAHVRSRARLVIAGDGPERAALAAHAGAAVTFLGQVEAARRDRLLGEASVVVVPSRVMPSGRTEGTPMIALEALAAGVPVVGSAVGGLRELAAIRLVEPEDPRALAAAIDHTLANPPAVNQLQAAIAHLDWARVAGRLT